MEKLILKWRSLEKEPPGSEHDKGLWVGHSKGGRMDYVFRWPDWKTGKDAFWCSGEKGNYMLRSYKPDVWYPGPPPIPGSDVEAIQKGKLP
jgi:hypothetical protein